MDLPTKFLITRIQTEPNMSKLYLVDQENVSFQPQSADEAIVLFNRLKRKNQVN